MHTVLRAVVVCEAECRIVGRKTHGFFAGVCRGTNIGMTVADFDFWMPNICVFLSKGHSEVKHWPYNKRYFLFRNNLRMSDELVKMNG